MSKSPYEPDGYPQLRRLLTKRGDELAAMRATVRGFADRATAWHADPNSSSSQLIDLANDIIDAAEAIATKETP